MITPLVICWISVGRSISVSRLKISANVRTPRNVPTIVARPPDERGAADHDGGDRVELVEVADHRRGAGEPAADEDRRDADADARQHVDAEDDPLDLHARDPRGLAVAADGDDVAPVAGAVEQHPARRP